MEIEYKKMPSFTCDLALTSIRSFSTFPVRTIWDQVLAYVFLVQIFFLVRGYLSSEPIWLWVFTYSWCRYFSWCGFSLVKLYDIEFCIFPRYFSTGSIWLEFSNFPMQIFFQWNYLILSFRIFLVQIFDGTQLRFITSNFAMNSLRGWPNLDLGEFRHFELVLRI